MTPRRSAAVLAVGALAAAAYRVKGRAAVTAARDLVSELTPPDLAAHHDLHGASAPPPTAGEVRVTFAGVSTLLVQDAATSLMIDGYFTRPGFLTLRLGRVRSDPVRVASALARLGVDTLDAVFVAHSHVDHALDSPAVASSTGAQLWGSRSTRRIAEAAGFDPDRYRNVEVGRPETFGAFTVTALAARHSPGDIAPGEIDSALPAAPRVTDLKTGDCYSFVIAHPAGTVVVHASANFVPGAFDGVEADTVYLGIGALGKQPAEFRAAYWEHVVDVLRPRTVVPIHWDNFTRSLDRPLKPFPRRFDDLGVTMAFLRERAAQAGVRLVMPRAWQRTDPFA